MFETFHNRKLKKKKNPLRGNSGLVISEKVIGCAPIAEIIVWAELKPNWSKVITPKGLISEGKIIQRSDMIHCKIYQGGKRVQTFN